MNDNLKEPLIQKLSFADSVTTAKSRRNTVTILEDIFLSFENVIYTIKTKEKEKRILDGVSGFARSGEVFCIMGPSGAGKTCLMNVLAARGLHGDVEGKITLNGRPLKSTYRGSAFVCADEDSLYPTLTVQESFKFSAVLRLPRVTTYENIDRIVAEVIDELDLTQATDSKIGFVGSGGLSTGQRRRVAIGVELVAGKCLLFLDEPTSGLDSTTALTVVNIMSKLAKKGRTVVTVLHQPRTKIYESLDSILLLSKNGTTVYFGPGKEAQKFFAQNNFIKPASETIADYMLDVAQSLAENELPQYHEFGQKMFAERRQIYCPREYLVESNEPITEEDALKIRRACFMYQMWACTKRAMRHRFRSFNLIASIYTTAIFIGILGYIFYPNLGVTYEDFQDRVALLTMLPYATSLFCTTGFEVQKHDRHVFELERENRYYNPIAFIFGISFADILQLRILPPILTGLICYFPCGLQDSGHHFAIFLVVLILMNIVGAGLSRCIGSVVRENGTATLSSSALILLMLLYCGFLVNPDTIPDGMKWFQDISLFYWGCGLLYFNEMENFMFTIASINTHDTNFKVEIFNATTDKFICDVLARKEPILKQLCGEEPINLQQLACDIQNKTSTHDFVNMACEEGRINVEIPGSFLLDALSLTKQDVPHGVGILSAMVVCYFILAALLALVYHRKKR
jgi:ATP-binding cassette subfamily G (WHITE) protein 2